MTKYLKFLQVKSHTIKHLKCAVLHNCNSLLIHILRYCIRTLERIDILISEKNKMCIFVLSVFVTCVGKMQVEQLIPSTICNIFFLRTYRQFILYLSLTT